MKTSLPLLSLTAVLCHAFALSVSHGQLVYEDNFTTSPGLLDGRVTAPGFGNWVNADDALVTGGGWLSVDTNLPLDYHSATFALPTLQATDILEISLTVRPAGGGFLGIGFTESPGQYVITSGFSWLYVEGVGGQVPAGVQVFRGIGNADNVYTGVPSGFDPNLPTTYNFSYNPSAKTIGISATNGMNSFEFFSALDVQGLPASGFSNFALQFQGQNLTEDGVPSYVDSIRVEVVPEPATNVLLGIGAALLGVAWVRRSRLVAVKG